MEHDFFRSISWRALYGRRVEAPIRPCEGWNPPETISDDQPIFPTPAATNDDGKDPLNLDAATANFDNTFTRMPVGTEDNTGNHSDDDLDELNEDTFIGFTFDEKVEEENAGTIPARQRTHHSYQQNNNEIGHDSAISRHVD
jgi:hypothetical protein